MKKNKKRLTNIIIIILVLYIFVKIIKNEDVKTVIINETNKKFNPYLSKYNSFDKTDMVYEILGKIIDFDELDTKVNLEDIKDIPEVHEKEDVVSPSVYIYNSHQTESYFEPLINDYTITPSVLFASHILKEYLKEYNIESIVEGKSMKKYLTKNNLEYKDSYEASRYYAKNILKEYKGIKYLIDIHRDSVKKDKTVYKNNKINYAKVMFVVGTNHKNYKKNLSFVKELNNELNKKYKGLSRGIYIRKDARFNQDLSENAILIELGGVDNTISEINNTLKILSKILSEYMVKNDGK